MGYRQAIEDGVRTAKTAGSTRYFVPCCLCGAEVQSMNYLRERQYACPSCREALERAKRAGLKVERAKKAYNKN